MTYETDEEKVEAIKKWWKENGFAVAGGIVIGLVAIVGWREWGQYRDARAAEASSVFEQVLANAASGELDAVVAKSRQLTEDFRSTPYPALGLLVEAKAQYEAGEAAAAMEALARAISAAPDPAFARIAALRLARIQVAEGRIDEAAKTIEVHDVSADFAGEFAAVRGDVAVAQGDYESARTAYEQALAAGAGLSQLIRLKLDNLPAPG